MNGIRNGRFSDRLELSENDIRKGTFSDHIRSGVLVPNQKSRFIIPFSNKIRSGLRPINCSAFLRKKLQGCRMLRTVWNFIKELDVFEAVLVRKKNEILDEGRD